MCIPKQQRSVVPPTFDMSAFTTPKSIPTQRPKRTSKSGKRRDQFIVVQHHYHDHANECATSEEKLILDSAQQNPLVASFPMKLFMMLEQVEADGNAHIVSWQPHGRCFVVHEPELFKELLPRYFSLSKVSSFQRQLNLYDFTRLTRGKDKGGYYNEYFLRSRPHLLNKIQRIKVKGTGVRARSNPEQEPNFWTMPYVGATPSPSTAAFPMESSSSSNDRNQHVSSLASVVSEEDYSEAAVPAVVSSAQAIKDENQDVILRQPASEVSEVKLCGWGMPFYYLDSLPGCGPETQPTTGFDKSASSIDFLNSIDMDDFLDSVVDVDTDMSFNNLLEQIVD